VAVGPKLARYVLVIPAKAGIQSKYAPEGH
jgi:hypothetical protein